MSDNELKYSKTHEWFSPKTMRVGITEHAQELLGDMVFVELPEVGAVVKAGDELGVLESVKAASDFYAPISGEVIAINSAVVDNPSLVNSDPMDNGWLLEIKTTNDSEITQLMSREQYLGQISKE